MNYQGTIFSVNRNMALIMTDDHSFLRVKASPAYTVGQSVQFSDKELFTYNLRHTPTRLTYRQIQSMAAAAMLVLCFGLYSIAQAMPYRSNLPTVAEVTVKINPEVRFAVNAEGVVTSYTAMNEDAASLDLSDLDGLTLDAAVAAFTALATEAGFIDPADGKPDNVKVTMVPTAGNEAFVAELQSKLTAAATTDNTLQAVNMSVINTEEVPSPAESGTVPEQAALVNVDVDNRPAVLAEQTQESLTTPVPSEPAGTAVALTARQANNGQAAVADKPTGQQTAADVKAAKAAIKATPETKGINNTAESKGNHGKNTNPAATVTVPSAEGSTPTSAPAADPGPQDNPGNSDGNSNSNAGGNSSGNSDSNSNAGGSSDSNAGGNSGGNSDYNPGKSGGNSESNTGGNNGGNSDSNAGGNGKGNKQN